MWQILTTPLHNGMMGMLHAVVKNALQTDMIYRNGRIVGLWEANRECVRVYNFMGSITYSFSIAHEFISEEFKDTFFNEEEPSTTCVNTILSFLLWRADSIHTFNKFDKYLIQLDKKEEISKMIINCSKCGKKITTDDIESGKAFATTYELGYKAYCDECVEIDEYADIKKLLLNREFGNALGLFVEQSRKDEGQEDLELFMMIVEESDLSPEIMEEFNEWL